jgi:predicted alpha/beta-hydrolase family hydrolase
MGGRIASMIAATPEGREGVAGLVFLGYPLHPPGKPEVPRVKHLPLVKAPMLFVQGERDAFGTPAELMPVLKKTGARVVVVPEGEHSFKVPKRAGTPDEVMKRVMDEVAAFVLAKEKKR